MSMLTRTITLWLLFATLSPLSAQGHLDVQAGVSLNSAYLKSVPGTNTPNPGNILLYFAGVVGEYTLSQKWAAGLGVQYALRGSRYDVGMRSSGIGGFRRENLDFLPRVSFRILRNTDLLAGAYYSLLLDETIAYGGSDAWGPPIHSVYSKTDAGLAPGLRFQFSRWSVQAQAQIGLKDISTLEFIDESGNLRTTAERNLSFQLGAGYRIF